MKKLIFAAFAVCMLVACHPSGKCSDPADMEQAILTGSTDTAKYDLNGDGVVNISDLNLLLPDSTKVDTTKVDTTKVR